ncbi:beta-lactamase domain protein [Catenulispora acidiphila DSM 44928]|uniref:Beta-lactamase domain protein n=1 Tax=Catenulispora acidiphila (strain DSM 44928 / JCM 14897 / NBRC 102108 / NRRL B-24433 / ID139908) TaxID=479433 RepID=C7Q5C0_CATAD|nr:MBL fold metallo-hydrolase [Catenulispora acidiphila]ACU75889.1 beta-lactamase domain protein [Catenulispora acidiphila DSM 44928]
MSAWTETADRVFTRRFDPVNVTVTAVLGGDGVLVADTRCSVQEGRELREELTKLTPLPVRWVVNTHTHFDHMWGNAAFDIPHQEPPAAFWGHENMPDFDPEDPEFATFSEYLLREGGPEWQAKLDELVVRKPDHLVAGQHRLDLGGRIAELRHVGRGHTDNDLVVWLPDAAVAISGDLVEQSGPVAFGTDSFPLDWPATLTALADLTGPADLADRTGLAPADPIFIPGHGDPAGRAFLQEQQDFVTRVAAEIRRLHGDGVPVERAVDAGAWPIEDGAHFAQAVKRGYAQLTGALP